MESKIIKFTVNGRKHEMIIAPNTTLLRVLREELGYTDVKNGCESGDCGACAVLLDGKPVNSCMVLAWQAEGSDIVTCSGMGNTAAPHPIQEAFADLGAAQCGYCTPGMVISTRALLDENPNPTEAEIRFALSGNLCRCTGYGQIIDGVREAARRIAEKEVSDAY